MITILTASKSETDHLGNRKRLAKRFTHNGDGSWDVTSYDEIKYFNVTEVELNDFDDLATVLTALEDEPTACVIRGSLLPGRSPVGVRRKKDDPDPREVFFQENPNGVQWMMLDFDRIEAPSENMTDGERLDFLVSHLPSEFHDASFFYQWSSSAGLKGWKTPKAHLWFWLDEPWRDEFLKGKVVHEKWPVDTSVINPVQVNYTARPLFTNCPDPLPQRSGIVRKTNDAVSLGAWIKPQPPIIHREARQTPSEAFQRRLEAIGYPTLNDATLAAIACYVRLHGRDFDRHELKTKIREYIWLAPRSDSDKRRAASDRKLDEQINSAIRKYAN